MVLAGVKWSSCLVYIDDIVIMGKTFLDIGASTGEVEGGGAEGDTI